MLRHVMYKELVFMWRDRGLRYILFAVTLLSLLIFWWTYSDQVLKDIPAAVVDLDCSKASRDAMAKLEATDSLQVIAHPGSPEELKELIRRGEVKVGVVIPGDFARDKALGRRTGVQAIIDGSNILYATNASTAVMAVTRTTGAEVGVKKLMGGGMQYQEAEKVFNGVTLNQEPWFNPAMNYAYFLVLALVLNVWQQCCTLVSCTTICGETGRESWCQVKAAGFSRFKLFAGKSITHIFAFMLIIIPVYLIALGILKFPCENWVLLVLFTFVFAVSLHGIGTLASSIARNSLDATRYGMIIALPAFILSGYTWPLEAMPGWIQALARVIPQTWFFQGFNYLAFKNPGWEFISRYFIVLLVMAVIFYALAAFIVARRY